MFRPQNVKVFEPHNPELSLIDLMEEEVFEATSTEIYWFCMNKSETEDRMDVLDAIYGATNSITKKSFDGPYKVYGLLEINPILQELTRMGLEQKEEIDLIVNQASFYSYLHDKNPQMGDLFRISYLLHNDERKYTWYKVGSITPIDLFNFKYVNWMIHAEQTALADVSQEVIDTKMGD